VLLFSLFDPTAPSEDFFSWKFLQQAATNLSPALRPALLALAVAALVTPLIMWVAFRIGLLSHPSRARDIHTKPVPYGGGLAMYVAFATACLVFMRDDPRVPGLLILGAATVVVFLFDDRWGIPALIKLAIQGAIAVAAVTLFGFQIHFLLVFPFLQVHDLGLLILPVTVVWVLGMQNTTNLLDGVDGLAAGVVGVTALVLLIASAGRQPEVVALAAALAGACAGFLLFNFHPARIFMGDSGAYMLGLLLALLAVQGVAKAAIVTAIAVPVLAMAVPITDTALSIVRRHRNGQAITHGDAKHIHHVLLEAGLTQRQTCLLFYCTSGILGAAGLTAFGHRRILLVAIVLMLVLLSTVLGDKLRTSSRRVPAPLGRMMRQLLVGRAAR
jgi:UDP-GlcNAc:undecaprenyl-phosphate GlcNAc-1-phosphate transferase